MKRSSFNVYNQPTIDFCFPYRLNAFEKFNEWCTANWNLDKSEIKIKILPSKNLIDFYRWEISCLVQSR